MSRQFQTGLIIRYKQLQEKRDQNQNKIKNYKGRLKKLQQLEKNQFIECENLKLNIFVDLIQQSPGYELNYNNLDQIRQLLNNIVTNQISLNKLIQETNEMQDQNLNQEEEAQIQQVTLTSLLEQKDKNHKKIQDLNKQKVVKEEQIKNQKILNKTNELWKQPQKDSQAQLQVQQNMDDKSMIQFQHFQKSPESSIFQVYSRQNLENIKDENRQNISQAIIQKLKSKFDAYRPINQDGNSYFRAIGYAYLEHLIRFTTPKDELQEFIQNLALKKGYFTVRPATTKEMQRKHNTLRGSLLDLLQNLNYYRDHTNLIQRLESYIGNNEYSYDEALVWEMRTLTANYMEIHKDSLDQ